MPILGITGGIATGKTSFCALLRERVAGELFDADAAAHDLLANDPAVQARVVGEIHPEAYDAQGHPNRALLRELVFRDAGLRQKLEAILHPLIRTRWMERARAATAAGRIFLLDIPLLFEMGAEKLFDRIITVACTGKTQQVRLVCRPGMSAEMADAMIAAQMPLAAKVDGAHHVIWNEGSETALHWQADFLSQFLHARYH